MSGGHNSALSADGQTAYVASQVAAAPAIDLVGITAVTTGATFALDKTARALSAIGGKLYVTLAGSDTIAVLDAATGQAGTRSRRPAHRTTSGRRRTGRTCSRSARPRASSRSSIRARRASRLTYRPARCRTGSPCRATAGSRTSPTKVTITKTISVGAGPQKIAVAP